MKKLLVLLAISISGCMTPRYVYIVDDVYYSRPVERRPIEKRPHYTHHSMNMAYPMSPMMHWRMQQQRKQAPKPMTGPRRQNLETFRPQPQLPPPPPPGS